jgi:hypothetical protein
VSEARYSAVVEINQFCREQISKLMWEILEFPQIWALFSSSNYLKAFYLRCLTLIQYLTSHIAPTTCKIWNIFWKESLIKDTVGTKSPRKRFLFNCSSVFTSCVLSAVCGEIHKIIHGNMHYRKARLIATRYCFTWPLSKGSAFNISSVTLFWRPSYWSNLTREYYGRQLTRLAES